MKKEVKITDLYTCKLNIYGTKENIINFLDDFYCESYQCFLFRQFEFIDDYILSKYKKRDYFEILTEIENCTKYYHAVNNINNNCTTLYYNSFYRKPDINIYKILSNYYNNIKFELFYINIDILIAKQYIINKNSIKLIKNIKTDNKNNLIAYYDFAIENNLLTIEDVFNDISQRNNPYNIFNYFEQKFINDEYDITL